MGIADESLAIALLCRMTGFTVNESEEYARQLLHLLRSYFDEYVFVLVPAGEVEGLLRPFRPTHAVEITRRCERVRLDALYPDEPRRNIGFARGECAEPQGSRGEDTLVHIYPFLPTAESFVHLFQLALLQAVPLLISVMLQPTTLPTGVAEFLESQIGECERYVQGLSANGRTTLWEQAREYQRLQTKCLYGLRDNAALLQVRIASTRPVPAVLADTLGALVTQPAGGKATHQAKDFRDYLCGGYQVLSLDGALRSKVGKDFIGLQLTPQQHPLLPKSAYQLLYLFDSVEAGCAFQLPPSDADLGHWFSMRQWHLRCAPDRLPRSGTRLGPSHDGVRSKDVFVDGKDRRLHMYVVGKTGTGKSTLLKTMILSDMLAGEGLAVIDPHGDLCDELIASVPEKRWDDVVILDPTDMEFPVGLNLLECSVPEQRYFVVREMRAIMERLLRDQYQHNASDYAGPAFYQHMQMNMLLAMSDPDAPGTLLEFYEIFKHKNYWQRWTPLQWQEAMLKRWVEVTLPSIDYTQRWQNELTWGEYLSSRFDDFVFDPKLRLIFGQKRSTLSLQRIMDEGKILLVNLRKGELAEANARFLGMVLMAKIFQAAMQRATIPPQKRRTFYLYVDEFQSLATENFVLLLSEARKFGVALVLANQFTSQIEDRRIVESLFGNVGTLISFRVGRMDAEILEEQLESLCKSHCAG